MCCFFWGGRTTLSGEGRAVQTAENYKCDNAIFFGGEGENWFKFLLTCEIMMTRAHQLVTGKGIRVCIYTQLFRHCVRGSRFSVFKMLRLLMYAGLVTAAHALSVMLVPPQDSIQISAPPPGEVPWGPHLNEQPAPLQGADDGAYGGIGAWWGDNYYDDNDDLDN